MSTTHVAKLLVIKPLLHQSLSAPLPNFQLFPSHCRVFIDGFHRY